METNKKSAKALPPPLSDQKITHIYLKAFISGIVIFIISLIPILLASKGKFYMTGDYTVQNIPFWNYIIDTYKSGIPLYDMKSDLGMNYIGTYSYYGLTSPVILLGLIFPKSILPYAMTFIYSLSFGFASMGACMYSRRYTKKDISAYICGLLYAFSGAQLFNLVYQFSDSIAVFPFLLLSFDLLVKERKSFVFAALLALAGFVNYFFLWADCIFIAIYFFVKLFTKEYRLDKKLFFKTATEIIIGIGVTAIILLPAFMTLTGNSKATKNILSADILVYQTPGTIARIIQSLVMPPDICANGSLFSEHYLNCNSVALYIPLFSVIGVICVVMKNKKAWYSYLLYTCCVFMAIPLLNSIFSGFNSIYYARWFYMPTLIMAMVTGKFIDDFDEYDIKKPFFITLSAVVLFTLYGAFIVISGKFTGYFAHFILCLAIAYLNLAILYQLRYVDSKSMINRKNLLNIVRISCLLPFFAFTVCHAISYYMHNVQVSISRDTNDGYEIAIEDDEFFRVNTWSTGCSNVSLMSGLPSICSYNSLITGNTIEFWQGVGIPRGANVTLFMDDYPVASFLSTKYDLYYNEMVKGMVTVEPESIKHDAIGYSISDVFKNYVVYENENFIPMGYTFDYYIDIEDVNSIKYADEAKSESISDTNELFNVSVKVKYRKSDFSMTKQKLLLKGIWLTPEQIDKYSGILSELPSELFEDISDEAYITDCKNRKESACYYFEPTDEGFVSRINLDKDNLVFYSVPYDDSFTAYIDGKEAEIEKVFGGLSAVLVPQGDHTIEFCYTVKGLKEGITVSSVSLILFVCYIAITIINNTNKKRAV